MKDPSLERIDARFDQIERLIKWSIVILIIGIPTITAILNHLLLLLS